MKIYNEMTYEEIGNILYENIDDACTRNLALHVLEDREDARCNYLDFKEENTNLKQALNEIREYCNSQVENNETLIERLEGTNSFRIGNAKSMITEFKNILQIIDKYMKEDD